MNSSEACLNSDSYSDDENLEQLVLAKQQADLEIVEKMSEEEVTAYAKAINDSMVDFLTSEAFKNEEGNENKVSQGSLSPTNDYEEEEDDDGNDDAEDFFNNMEQELSNLMKPETDVLSSTSVFVPSSPVITTTSEDTTALSKGVTIDYSKSISVLEQLDSLPPSPTKHPRSPIASTSKLSVRMDGLSSPTRQKSDLAQSTTMGASSGATPPPTPPPRSTTSKKLFDVATGSYKFLSSCAATATTQVTSTASSLASFSYSIELRKHISEAKQAWSALNDIDEAAQDIEEQKQKRYCSLLSSPTAVEITIAARSCTKIPFVVAAGKDISWRFLVKDYDIGFSVCLQEKVYVLHGGGEGGTVENELIPFFKLSAYDKVSEKCCAERIPRYFVFILDNTHSTFRSKTLVYDVLISDSVSDDNESDCVERYQQSYQYEQKTSADHHIVDSSLDQHTPLECTYEYNSDHTNNQTEENETENCHFDLDGDAVEAGWGVFYDDQGYPYYYNHLTDVSQWQHPSEQAVDDGAYSGYEDGVCERTDQDDQVVGIEQSEIVDDDHYMAEGDSFERDTPPLDLVMLSSIAKASTATDDDFSKDFDTLREETDDRVTKPDT